MNRVRIDKHNKYCKNYTSNNHDKSEKCDKSYKCDKMSIVIKSINEIKV